MDDRVSLTELIDRAERGDTEAAERLFAATYDDLRRLARARLRAGGRNTLLDTSSLVHESYLRFAGAGRLRLEDCVHFMRWAGRVLDIRRSTLGPNHPRVGENLAALGGYYYRRADYERAKDFFGQALAVFPSPHGRRNPIAITMLSDFAIVHGQLNMHDEAEALQREGIELGRQVLGPDTATVANLVNNLGVTQVALGRHADAERSFREAFETHRSLFGEDHPRTRNVARNVGRALMMQDRNADALPWMDRAVGTAAASSPSADTGDPGIRAQRARLLFRLGRREEALKEGMAAVESVDRLTVADKSRPYAFTRLLLGRTLNEMGRPGEADRVLSLALRYYEPMRPEHTERAAMMCELARARAQHGGAENWERLKQCLPVVRASGDADPEVVADLERLLAARPGQ